MNRKHAKRLAVGLTVALAAVSGAASLADTPQELPSISVSYRYADLASDAGVQSLYARLQSAARHVCGVGLHQQLPQQAEARRCASKSLNEAVAALGDPQVAALHAQGRRAPAATRIAEAQR